MIPRPMTQVTLSALDEVRARRDRPAVRLVELATREAERDAATARLPRLPDPPMFAPRDGGCRTCGHTVSVHESGYQGRRVPCKAIGCPCLAWSPRRHWQTYLAVVGYVLLGAVIAVAACVAVFCVLAVVAART